jgi:phage terminase large subunit-like protein
MHAARITAPLVLIKRAEPVSAHYEQGRIRHFAADLADNSLSDLEAAMRQADHVRLCRRMLAQPASSRGLSADRSLPGR